MALVWSWHWYLAKARTCMAQGQDTSIPKRNSRCGCSSCGSKQSWSKDLSQVIHSNPISMPGAQPEFWSQNQRIEEAIAAHGQHWTYDLYSSVEKSSLNLNNTQERKLLAGPKLLDQAVLPKALWETAFYDVQSEYLVLPWIPLRARYLTEAWNDDWNHQFWVTKTNSCTVCTCNQKGVELQALPSTGCAHLPSLPHPKLQKGCKQKLRAPVVNAANGFGFLEGQAPVWRLKLVALRRRLRCRYMGICGEPEEQTGKFGYRTLEFCLVLSPIKKKKSTQTLLVILDMSSCKSFRAKVRLTCNEQAEVLTFSALLFKTPALQTFCGGSWKTVSKP